MFLGTHTPRLDDKGRLILPAPFREELRREELAEGLVVTKGQERCLYGWPRSGFRRLAERLREHPPASADGRAFQRLLFAGAHDQVPDRQGRITLPPALREYAGLRRECTVIGADTRIEIWDSAAWAGYLDAHEPAFASFPEAEGAVAEP